MFGFQGVKNSKLLYLSCLFIALICLAIYLSQFLSSSVSYSVHKVRRKRGNIVAEKRGWILVKYTIQFSPRQSYLAASRIDFTPSMQPTSHRSSHITVCFPACAHKLEIFLKGANCTDNVVAKARERGNKCCTIKLRPRSTECYCQISRTFVCKMQSLMWKNLLRYVGDYKMINVSSFAPD